MEERKKDEYIIRIGIDSDVVDTIWDKKLAGGTKQIARQMIQESNFTTIRKVFQPIRNR